MSTLFLGLETNSKNRKKACSKGENLSRMHMMGLSA